MTRGAWTRGFVVLASLALAACAGAPPSSESQPNQAQVDSSLRAAALASQEVRNYAGAAAYYSSLYERNPEDLDIVLGYARNLRYLGDVGRAQSVIETALETNEDEPRLLSEYGRVLLASDQPDKALAPLQTVADGAPDDWQTRSALGIAYDMLDRHEEAIAAYESALAIAPGNSSVLNNLALSQAMAGDIEGGEATLRRASLRSGSGVQMRQNLALLLALDGQLEEAEAIVSADLPSEMARRNIAYLRKLAEARGAEGAEETPIEELETLPVLTNLPKLEPIPATVDVVAEPLETTPTEGTDAAGGTDFAATAGEAADEAFAALIQADPEAASATQFGAQLASFTSLTDAEQGQATLEGKLGAQDPSRALRVVTVERGEQAPIFRVYAGPFTDVETARETCRQVRERAVACVVSPMPAGS